MAGTTKMPSDKKKAANDALVLSTVVYVAEEYDLDDDPDGDGSGSGGSDSGGSCSVYDFVNRFETPPEGATDNKSLEINILKGIMSDEANAEYWSNVYVSHPSWQMGGYNEGTVALTFTDSDGNVTVAYRGTHDGEWLDNSFAYAGSDSPQQVEALRYFNEVVEGFDGDYFKDHTLSITGHSKGGNKAQYVTLVSEYGDKIDWCYSFDGQGFSPEAVDAMKMRPNYGAQLEKMYSICGENDYVNVLGCIQVFLDRNVFYVETNKAVRLNDFHEVAFLFEDGKMGNIDGVRQGGLAKFVSLLSDTVAKFPYAERLESARSIMQVFEVAFGGITTNYEGEIAGLRDFTGLIVHSLPVVIEKGISSEEGRALILEKLDGALQGIYEKNGIYGVVGLMFSTGALISAVAPLLILLTADIAIFSTIVDKFYHFYDAASAFGENAVKTAAELMKGAIKITADISSNIAGKVTENAEILFNATRQIGATIVANAAKAMVWSQRKLLEAGTSLALLINEGNKKILIVTNELADVSRRIALLREIREAKFKQLRFILETTEKIMVAYGQAYVRTCCNAVLDELEKLNQKISLAERMLLDMERSLALAKAALVQADEQEAQRVLKTSF